MLPKGEKRSKRTFDQNSEDEVSTEDSSKSSIGRPQKALFVKNLPPDTCENDVMALHCGIQTVKLDVAKNLSKTKYALLDFVDEESANDALKKINGSVLNGHKLFVDYLESSAMISYNQSSVVSQAQDPLKLYVTGFGQNMTQGRLMDLFPTASGYNLELHPKTKKSIGFAFVSFESTEDARKVHDSMQDSVYDGRVLVVMYAKNESSDGGALLAKKPKLDDEIAEEWNDDDDEEEEDYGGGGDDDDDCDDDNEDTDDEIF